MSLLRLYSGHLCSEIGYLQQLQPFFVRSSMVQRMSLRLLFEMRTQRFLARDHCMVEWEPSKKSMNLAIFQCQSKLMKTVGCKIRTCFKGFNTAKYRFYRWPFNALMFCALSFGTFEPSWHVFVRLTLTIQDLSKEHTPFCRSCQLALGEGHVATVHHGKWPMARNESRKEQHGWEEQWILFHSDVAVLTWNLNDIKIGNIGKGLGSSLQSHCQVLNVTLGSFTPCPGLVYRCRSAIDALGVMCHLNRVVMTKNAVVTVRCWGFVRIQLLV